MVSKLVLLPGIVIWCLVLYIEWFAVKEDLEPHRERIEATKSTALLFLMLSLLTL